LAASSGVRDWTSIAIPAVPVLACFLGGATERWSQGVVIGIIGILILARPPKASLGWTLNAPLAALVACAGIAFLPARWFLMPAWRTAIGTDFGITLPATLSPQPWLTLDGAVVLLAGLSWLYFLAAREPDLGEVRSEVRIFAAGVMALAALCIGLYLAHTALPFWHNQRGFGPFPNRNQTGDLFGIAAILILACGQEDLRRGNKRSIVWLIGVAVVVVALILNFSRAGIGILVFGCAIWLAVTSLRKRSGVGVAVACSALLILLTAMLVFGGHTLERFNLRGGQGEGVSSDFRWLIFHDAFRLIAASPWPGIGIGNFESVFAIFRDASITENRALHPESDWIWLWVELGPLGVVLCLAGAIALLKRAFPLKERTNQRLRSAALIGAIIFALHGLVDVSAHRLGTALAGLFVATVALHRPQMLRASRLIAPGFRALGLLLVCAGGAWTVSSFRHVALPGSIGVANAKQAAVFANRHRLFADAADCTTRALEWAPLDWELYFLRGIAEIGANRPQRLALDDFRRARFLEPNSYKVPLDEGRAWIAANPLYALTAWREALRRAGPSTDEIYGSILGLSSVVNPEAHRALQEMSLTRPELTLAYLNRLSGNLFDTTVARVLARDPELTKFTREQRARLFELWSEKGGAEALSHAIESHPAWLEFAWQGVAKFEAGKKDFRAAVELTRRFCRTPDLPPLLEGVTTEQLQRRTFGSTTDFAAGFTLSRNQMKEGKTDDALVTIRHFTDERDCPSYFHFLEAECWEAKGDWERTWEALERYQRQRR
jgi:O-antigen ligase